jgi:hypothetical protein
MPPPSRNQPPRARSATGQAAARPRRTGVAPAVRPAAKLVCSAGPASGQEFPLSGDEVTIGRAADATVSVPDTSVSRKHALLRKTEEGWAISDLGSGNGTIVNGEQVPEEQPLANDDVITLGDSEFQYVDGSGGGAAVSALAPSPRRAPVRTSRTGGGSSTGRPRTARASRLDEDPAVAAKKRRKLFILVGTTLCVVMALGVGFKAIDNKNKKAAAVKTALIKEKRDELLGAFQAAKGLIKEARFDEARQQLEAIIAEDEQATVLRGDEKKSIATYLETANREVPNETFLQDAGKALTDDHLGQAAALLGKVKTSIPSTEKRLETLKATLETKLGEKVMEARKKLSSGPKDLALMEQVKTMAEDVLAARPEDRDAPEIKKQAEDNIARIKNPNLPPPIPETPHLEVMNRFRNGDQSGAVSLAQACAAKSAQCRSLEGQLRDFDSKFKGLDGLAAAELWALYQLDKKIAGGQSSDLSKPIKTKVASVFMLEASKAKTVGDWVRAIGNARKVLEVDAQHPAANAIIQEARQKANDIYLRGYQLKETSPDEAAKLFKEVLLMTPDDDTVHQKAKSRLEELQRQ